MAVLVERGDRNPSVAPPHDRHTPVLRWPDLAPLIHEHPIDRGDGTQLGVLNPLVPGRGSAAAIFFDEVTSLYRRRTPQHIEFFEPSPSASEQGPPRPAPNEHVLFPFGATVRTAQEHGHGHVAVHVNGDGEETSPSRQGVSTSERTAANQSNRFCQPVVCHT